MYFRSAEKTLYMRTMLSNLLEKTAVMRVLSGGSRRMSGSTAPIPDDLDPKFGNISAMSEDISEKSPDYFAMTGNIRSMSGIKAAMLPNSTGMFGNFRKRTGVIAALLANIAGRFCSWLLRHPFRRREEDADQKARRGIFGSADFDAYFTMEGADFDEHFTLVYTDSNGHRCDDGTNFFYPQSWWSERYPSIDRRIVIAILIVFASALLGLFSSVARTVVNWQPPLHRRATRIPRGCRPPPAWAAPWSIC